MEDPGDVSAVLSISDFLTFIGAPLSCPDSKPISHLHIFSAPELQPRKVINNLSNSTTKVKIKSSLDLFDFILFPTLIQFWAPTIVEEDDHLLFLDSSDIPFGLSFLRKGLCSFRKQSLMHKYKIDGGNCGPPARVFRRRFPEFCPDVRFYSCEEFALRDHAVRCGMRGYLALPVFEPVWKNCIGVIELLTVMDGSYCLTDWIHKVSDSLKKVGLSSSDVFWPFDKKRVITCHQNENGSTELRLAFDEIEKALAALCNTHKLPFAQTWILTTDAINMECVLSTSKNGSYMRVKKAASFQRDCINFYLRKGQGVVWKAFLSSSSSCFCRDISQLRICDYGLVFSARRADLTGSFAFCLQSTYTGDFVYIVELWLPPDKTIYTEPWIFLSLLLATMKKEFKTFTLRSGQEIGDELHVEVIRICKDELHDSFVIKKTTPEIEGSKKPQNMAEPSSCEGETVHELVAKHNRRNYFCAKKNTVPRLPKNVALKTMSSGVVGDTKLLGEQQSKRPKIVLDIPSVGRSTSMKSIHEPGIHSRTPPQRITTENPILEKVATIKQEENFMTIEADFKGDVIRFQLCPSSGMANLKDEVMKRLKLSTGTFKIEYLNVDKHRVPLNTDGELHQYMIMMRSLEIITMKLFIESVVPQNESMETEVSLIVKAKHKDDLVKFDLPHSGIVGLKNEIMKRFKLEAGSFEVKYDQILLDNDAALRNCIGSMNMSQNMTMRLSIEPLRAQETTDGECLLTVKASYKDDIIRFQISSSSGMVELKNQLMKRLKLEDGSFVIKYVDKDRNEIVLDKDALLNSHFSDMKSMGMSIMKIFLV